MSLRDLSRGRAYGDLPLEPGLVPVTVPLPSGVLTGLRGLAADFADQSSRGTILLLPGYTGSKEDFRQLLPQLARAGWDALAVSRRGQGDSEGSTHPNDYTLEAETGDVVEVLHLLREQNRPVHLLGHSLGGVIARAATIAAPEVVASLTMMCAGPHGWAHRKFRESRLAAEEGVEALWRASNPQWIGRAKEEMDSDTSFVYRRMIDTGAGSVIGGEGILESPEDTTEDLGRTSVPVHVVRGQTDEHWPSQWQERMAQRLGARYSVIPDADHSPQLENPNVTAHTLSHFWNATQSLGSRPDSL